MLDVDNDCSTYLLNYDLLIFSDLSAKDFMESDPIKIYEMKNMD